MSAIRLIPLRAIAVLIAMLLAAGLSVAAKPRVRVADAGPKVSLEQLIPEHFGDWSLDKRVVPVLPSPEAQAVLNKIYNQTLSRTYFNSRGDRVMLSVAYGGDQSDSMQVHKPEVCYPAQGFAVLKTFKAQLRTPFGNVPVSRLVAQQGPRVEPITYWITVGDRVANSGLDRKIEQLKYGLTGKVPDGMLVRVSTIDRDEQGAYDTQSQFVDAMLSAMSPEARSKVAGRGGS